jgi:hypothetical protein
MAPYGDTRLGAEVCLFKFESEILTQIGAALNAAATASATAKHIAEAEKLAEDVAEILEYRGIKPGTGGRRAADAGVAESVVSCALVSVSQDSIGFADFLELLLSIRIVGIPVGVILERELAIGGL